MKYDHKLIDNKWQGRWEESGIFHAEENSKKEKFYCLVEFPYPSGAGLHIGHPRSYTALDIIARKARMEGKNVLYPMGWDAFGLPTENYAIKTGRKPEDVTAENIITFKRQLKSLGLSFDWSREINTTDPAYYKWTQWQFLQFFKAGLAYKDKMAINWCMSCKTGLANEEVVDGACERCGGEVEKRNKEQWMIAITKYADRLIEDLDTIDYLPKIKKQQKDWIGRSEGAEVIFKLVDSTLSKGGDREVLARDSISVFTTRPDTLFGATYMVLAPEHPLVSKIVEEDHKVEVDAYVKSSSKKTEIERGDAQKEKTGVFTGSYAVNPVNGEKIPIWVADYVLMGYGTGAIMAVPAHDERDFAFATKFDLPIVEVVAGEGSLPRTEEGTAINSGEFDGLTTTELKVKITEWLAQEGKGKIAVNFKLRDWVFSRQRYWGEPIPLVHCKNCEGAQTEQKDVFLFHGWDGSTEGDFFPSLKADLKKKGYNVFMFNAPNAEEPVFEEWLAFAREKIDSNRTGAPLTIVGHSMGGHLSAKLAELYELERLVLVAPVGAQPSEKYFDQYKDTLTEDEFKIYKDFQDHPIDFDAIKKNVGDVRVIFGMEDKWITDEIRDQYRVGLSDSAQFVEINGRGHLSTNAGVTHLEAIESMFDSLKSNGWVAVPDSDLPVKLPDVEKYEPTDTGESPLAVIEDWVNTICPTCGGPARRETDTMPNWAGSSWYFLRYIDPHNDKAFADPEKLKEWTPVDWYNGGMEHTTLHLLYSRFWNKFLYDRGHVPVSEPYAKRTSHGLILAEDGEKMSKSRGNVVNPDELVEKFGADTLRIYEMFIGPFAEAVPWSTNGVIGMRRFLDKVMTIKDAVQEFESEKVTRALHQTIKKVTTDIESMRFNTAVAQMMTFVNVVGDEGGISKPGFETFLTLLCPFAPHVANELYEQMGGVGFLEACEWPIFNEDLAAEKELNIAVQVNGKLRSTIVVKAGTGEDEVVALARAEENVDKFMVTEPSKIIYVPGKLVNFVI